MKMEGWGFDVDRLNLLHNEILGLRVELGLILIDIETVLGADEFEAWAEDNLGGWPDGQVRDYMAVPREVLAAAEKEKKRS